MSSFLNSDDFTWPSLDDDLLEIGDNWSTVASINKGWNPSYALVEGYKQAADTLVKEAVKDSVKLSFLVYPIVYNYRHHIELMLKKVIKDGCKLLDWELPNIQNHWVDNLWGHAKKVIEEVWPEGPKDDLIAVENTIEQLKSIDPDSFHFRYLESTKGELHNQDLSEIDIINFSKVMNNLSSFLSGTNDGILHYQEMKDDIRSNYHP